MHHSLTKSTSSLEPTSSFFRTRSIHWAARSTTLRAVVFWRRYRLRLYDGPDSVSKKPDPRRPNPAHPRARHDCDPALLDDRFHFESRPLLRAARMRSSRETDSGRDSGRDVFDVEAPPSETVMACRFQKFRSHGVLPYLPPWYCVSVQGSGIKPNGRQGR